MVILPELSISDIHLQPHEQAHKIPGQLTSLFSSLAKKHGVWLIPGSVYEKAVKTSTIQLSFFLQKVNLLGNIAKIPLVPL